MNSRPGRDNFLIIGSSLIGEEEIDEIFDSLRSGWTTTKFTKWPCEHGQIIKSRLSYSRREKCILTVVEFGQGRIRFEGYLGNVG